MNMKHIGKKFKGAVLILSLILLFSLTACGEKVPELKEANSREEVLGYFKVSVFDYFKQTTGEESEETTKYFTGGAGETAFIMHLDQCNHSSNDARLDFLCEYMAEAYHTTSKRIRRDKLGEGRYYLYWDSINNGKHLPCGAYVVYAENYEFSLYEVDTMLTEEELRRELTEMGETAVYTGPVSLKLSDYTLETTRFRIHVKEGFDSPGLQDADEDPSGNYTVDSDSIAVYYREADSYDRGDAYFKLTYLSDQTTDIAELAKKKAENQDGTTESNRTLEETTIGGVWPELTDESLKSTKAYRLDISIEDNPYLVEIYYFAVDGNNYSVGLIYPAGDETTRKDLLAQFEQVEFIKTEK